MPSIDSGDVIRCMTAPRSPFQIEYLPFLARLHDVAFLPRRKASKRFVGKPAKRLYRLLRALGLGGRGRVRVASPAGMRVVEFDVRNTQFGALYQRQSQPVYEAETSALLDLLVADDGVFLDVGANWGWYSVLIATRPGFRGRVHAFEPFPTTFADLESVVRQAGLDQLVTCHAVALADQPGEASMGFSDGLQSGLARLGEAGGTRVRLVRLDDMDVSPVDVIKVDAEDHELDVLAGADATIARDRPFVVYENWLHRDQPDLTLAPTEFLAQRGYRFFYPAWGQKGRDDCITAAQDGSRQLALVPFLPAQRFVLPSQLNIVAVPSERVDLFRSRLERMA